jgi:hypothetical protein
MLLEIVLEKLPRSAEIWRCMRCEIICRGEQVEFLFVARCGGLFHIMYRNQRGDSRDSIRLLICMDIIQIRLT